MKYKIPDNYFFRLNHVRPRFKNDLEEVLLYVADAISGLPEQKACFFEKQLFSILKSFKANFNATDKTINNWRTEISALFSFIEIDDGNEKPSKMAIRLSETRNLTEFFNYFLLSFQYPGGHVKPKTIVAVSERKIKFKPCKFILETLLYGTQKYGNNFSVTAEEITQCAYYDLRVLTGKRTYKDVAKLVYNNRKKGVIYDHKYKQLKTTVGKYPSAGDVYRYSGDILDYMVLANLLIYKSGHYFINNDNKSLISIHITKDIWFSEYDKLSARTPLQTIKQIEQKWIKYVNSFDSISEFSVGGQKAKEDIDAIIQLYYDTLKRDGERQIRIPTKHIGDLGEWLVLAHEIRRTKEGDAKRNHLIALIPTPLGVGYDIQSIEVGEKKRYIEVKTTRSMKAITLNSFTLTPNEWDTAKTLREHYYIYYLTISRENGKKLFIVQDPVKELESGNLELKYRVNGSFNLTFNNEAGIWTDLLEI